MANEVEPGLFYDWVVYQEIITQSTLSASNYVVNCSHILMLNVIKADGSPRKETREAEQKVEGQLPHATCKMKLSATDKWTRGRSELQPCQSALEHERGQH